MSGIQTGIELHDQFSNVLNGIIGSVNLAVSAMYDMQEGMGADIDTRSLEGAREEINQATAALNAMNEALSRQAVSVTVLPADGALGGHVINVDVDPVLPEPLVENPEPIRTEVQPNAPPEPVEIPVVWQSDGMEVFTGTGMDRFRQEIQSANSMLEQLSSTQDAIARQAYGSSLFSPEAFQNLNRLAVRVDMMGDRIRQIGNNPINFGTDRASAELEQLRMQLDRMVQEQNELNSAVQDMDISAANAAYLRLSQTVSGTERYIRDNVDEQGRFNQAIAEGAHQANGFTSMIRNAAAAYVSIRGIGKAMDISDSLVQTTSRLSMMNDGAQDTQELVNMVYVAAQDARGSFAGMADVVARFGNNAKDAFSSSEEVVAFANLIQKQMTIAGASTQEASNAMLQLSQAMGSGVLRGDELNSIFEQAPNIIQSIADYLDVPIGQIREMASEGELSADVVKAAVFASADEINAKFESMPMTWGQVWQSMQNTALIAFQPVLQRLNGIANSEAFQTLVDGAVDSLATLANIALEVFDFMASCGQFVADNWSIISPIIWGIVAALAVYGAYLAITNGIELATAAAKGALAVAEFIHCAAVAASTGATIAATAAQMGLNGAMYACPIVWIIMLVIALIAVILAVCNAIAGTTEAVDSGLGIIVGSFAVAGALILNTAIGVLNSIIQCIWTKFVEPFIGIVEWVLNVAYGGFDSFGDAVASLIGSILSWFLSLGKTVTKIIDAIFGTDWTAGLTEMQNSVLEWGKNENAITLDRTAPTIDYRIDYGSAWDAGASWGDGVADAVSSFSLSDMFGGVGLPDVQDYASQFAGIGDSLEGISADTGSISDALDITQEDLKYLRDIAEQEAVNRYTVAEINIDQSGMQNNIGSSDGIDGFMEKLTDSVNEAVDIMTEGVHV